ncbi:MAG TPA: hypothetical protein VGM70_01770 [Pseudolysinimonas sp.]|jgi:hypothetical protein
MDIFKGISDMEAMVAAAPGLIESANKMAASAQANAAAYQQQVPGFNAPAPEPQAGNLDPIAGVSLELYAQIAKELATVGYDQSKAAGIAATHGVSAANWTLAEKGWGDRIRADHGVGVKFNALYTA